MAKKKTKELSPEERLQEALVPEEEWPYEVPGNWCWTRIGYFVSVKGGKRVPKGKKLYEEKTDHPYIRVTDFAELEIDCAGLKYIDDDTYESIKNYTISSKDIYISIAGSIGKVGVIPTFLEGANLTENAAKITDIWGYDRDYLLRFLTSDFAEKQMKESTISTSQPKLALFRIENIIAPLSPLPEQHRIVARIESLFSKLDEAKEAAQAVVDGFADRKAAILHKAFTGELTKEWREKNNVQYSDYIEISKAKRDNEIKKHNVRKLKYTMPDDAVLPSIPKEWQYLQIGDVAWSIKDGPHYSPNYVDEGIPFITGGNVRPNGIDFDNAKRITHELHEELSRRCHPEKGDMLYTKGGTTGIARINTYDFEFSVWVHVAVIKFVDSIIPEYFQMVLNSPLCYEQSQKYTHGVGNQDLGLTRMINIILPICSINEQKEIVRYVGDMIDNEHQVNESAESVLEQIDIMKKSILARAFRGELGTNDIKDENAVEMLKRVLSSG